MVTSMKLYTFNKFNQFAPSASGGSFAASPLQIGGAKGVNPNLTMLSCLGHVNR